MSDGRAHEWTDEEREKQTNMASSPIDAGQAVIIINYLTLSTRQTNSKTNSHKNSITFLKLIQYLLYDCICIIEGAELESKRANHNRKSSLISNPY